VCAESGVFADIAARSVAVPVMTSAYVAGLVKDGDGNGAGVGIGVVVVPGCTKTVCLHNACSASVIWLVSAGRSGLWARSQMSVSVASVELSKDSRQE
jgi:hypothetical protein